MGLFDLFSSSSSDDKDNSSSTYRDEYGHVHNDKDVEIRAHEDKYGTTHIDIYSSCPANDNQHDSIHINYDSDSGKGTITEKTDGETETTDFGGCFLTTACMRNKREQFDDNCEELQILRWFRDNFVSQEDIDHYYKIAPLIVSAINEKENSNIIFNSIYNDVIVNCVNAIKNNKYDYAYLKYKKCILELEEEYAKPVIMENIAKTLRYKISNQ